MTDSNDELEKLLSDVRKTISDNRQFLDRLIDETIDESEEDEVVAGGEEVAETGEFEEL